MTMITLTGGTAFIMWLGEQITEGYRKWYISHHFCRHRGKDAQCNCGTMSLVNSGEMNWFVVLLLIAMMFVVIAFIIFMESSQRIPVQYAKRGWQEKMYGGQSTSTPEGQYRRCDPPHFASSILMFPATMASLLTTPYEEIFLNF